MATDAAPANWRDQLKLPPKDIRIRTEVSVVCAKEAWAVARGGAQITGRGRRGGGQRRKTSAGAWDPCLCPPSCPPAAPAA